MKLDKKFFQKNLIYILILVIGVGGLTFVGFKFLKSSKDNNGQVAGATTDNSNPANSQGGWQGRRGSGSGAPRGNLKPLHGIVSSISGQTIIIKADDGSSKNIITSSSTRIMRQDTGQRVTLTLADIKQGDEINVMTSDAAQTDIQARMIIIGQFSLPQGGFGGGGYGGNGPSAPSDPSAPDSQSQTSI